MNLQTKLDGALNEVLKTSGYIFEVINNNKSQSNLITGPNNQLISPSITAQLANNVAKFDDILDETIGKFNDARWCIEQLLENKQKQEEMRLREEMDRQRRLKEEEEMRRQEAEKKRQEEVERKRKEEAEKRDAQEREEAKREADRKEQERLEHERQEQEKQAQEKQLQDGNEPDFNDFMAGGFDFENKDVDVPNPVDILSSINYEESGDLDMNNLLGNGESLLEGLGMGEEYNEQVNDDDFDVDNFLNQFGN